jgi:flagellar export protein FliJ
MAFRFTLAAVLRFRESVEKREEMALQKVLMQMAQVRRTIESLTAQIERAHKLRHDAMQNPQTAFELRAMLAHAEVAAERRTQLIVALKELDEKRHAQMNAYQAAHRNRQMLSEMAVRQRDAWELEHARAQQKFVDDIFASRSRFN